MSEEREQPEGPSVIAAVRADVVSPPDTDGVMRKYVTASGRPRACT